MPKFFTKEQITSIANQIKTYIDTKFGKAVLFTPQTLADSEKAQARTNINTDKPSENKTISGDIASFTDGSSTPVKDLKATLDVVQPLNGYVNPWPAGGNKNMLEELWEQGAGNANGISTRIRCKNTIPVEAGKTYTFSASSYSNFKFVLNSGVTQSYPWTNVTYCGNNALWMNSSITFTATESGYLGVIVSKNDDSDIIPAEFTGVNCQFEESATPTSYVPYTNICPIYPVTEVEVSRTGKNLFDPSLLLKATGWTKSGDEYTGYASNLTAALAENPDAFKFKENTQYVISAIGRNTTSNISNARFGFLYTDGTSSQGGYIDTTTNKSIVCISTAGKTIKRILLSYSTGQLICLSNVQLEEGSTATAYTPYNGIQYLVNIGINQWDEEWEVGVYDTNGQKQQTTTNYIRSANKFAIIPNTTYYMKKPICLLFFCWYDAEGNFIERVNPQAVAGGDYTFTTPQNAYYMAFCVGGATSPVTTYNYDISINYPSSFTEYYPYTGRQVYGGELDVTTGVLTSRYAFKDLGTATWQIASNGNFFAEDAAPGRVFANTLAYCSNYARFRDTGGAAETILNGTFCFQSNQSVLPRVIIRDDAYTDAATFKTAMAGVQLVYQLASPLTIQLTPTEVQTLTGTNNLWADSGAVNVSYWTEGLIEADNLNAVLDSKKVVYASPHTYSKEDALQARLNIGAGSNSNLLDNPFFSVNQRGNTSGNFTATTKIDRWRTSYATSYNGTWTLNDGVLTITADSSYAYFVQRFEDYSFMSGKTLTASLMLSDGTIVSGTAVRTTGRNDLISVAGKYGVYIAISGEFTIQVNPNQTLAIKAAKLEYGSVSTLVNDTSPDYAEELAKCQRYFVRLKSTLATAAPLVGDFAISTGAIDFIIALPQSLAKLPTITQAGVRAVTVTGTAVPITSVTAMDIMANNLRLRAYGTFTQNTYYKLTISQNSYIDISAEP